jgi:hypothetical protein
MLPEHQYQLDETGQVRRTLGNDHLPFNQDTTFVPSEVGKHLNYPDDQTFGPEDGRMINLRPLIPLARISGKRQTNQSHPLEDGVPVCFLGLPLRPATVCFSQETAAAEHGSISN